MSLSSYPGISGFFLFRDTLLKIRMVIFIGLNGNYTEFLELIVKWGS